MEHENKRLRENQFESSKIEEMELTIESLRDREQELSSENRFVKVVDSHFTQLSSSSCRKEHEMFRSMPFLPDELNDFRLKRSQTCGLGWYATTDFGYSLPMKCGRRYSKPSTDSGCHSPYGTSNATSEFDSPSRDQVYETVSDKSWHIDAASIDCPCLESDDEELILLDILSSPPRARTESISSYGENDRSLSVIELSNPLKSMDPPIQCESKRKELVHVNSFNSFLNRNIPDINKVRSLPNLKLPHPPNLKILPAYQCLQEIPFADDSEAHNPIEVIVITNKMQRDFSDDSMVGQLTSNDHIIQRCDFSGSGIELKPIPENNHYEEIPKKAFQLESHQLLDNDHKLVDNDIDTDYNIRLVQSEIDEGSIYTSLVSRPHTGLGNLKKLKKKNKLKRALSATTSFFFSICGP